MLEEVEMPVAPGSGVKDRVCILAFSMRKPVSFVEVNAHPDQALAFIESKAGNELGFGQAESSEEDIVLHGTS